VHDENGASGTDTDCSTIVPQVWVYYRHSRQFSYRAPSGSLCRGTIGENEPDLTKPLFTDYSQLSMLGAGADSRSTGKNCPPTGQQYGAKNGPDLYNLRMQAPL